MYTFQKLVYHRYCLCEKRNWLVFGQLTDPNWSVDEWPLSPKAKLQCSVMDLQTGPLQPLLCHWKLVYIKAHMLSLHWEQGVYKLSPLLKAHRDPITAMDCDGQYVQNIWVIAYSIYSHVYT